MKTLITLAMIALAGSASAQDNKLTPEQLDRLYKITQKADAEVRARNATHEWFFVSTIKSGLAEWRFYVDRKTILAPDQSGIGRAWIDSYDVVGAKRPIRMEHTKALEEVRCGNEPQMRFKTVVTYEPDGKIRNSGNGDAWADVIPGTSMETVHRFICDPEPANAFNDVAENPQADAMRYFVQQAK